jgi:hypothetical protein
VAYCGRWVVAKYPVVATIAFDSEEEVLEVQRALLKARAELRSFINDKSRLVGGGYADRTFSDSIHVEIERAKVQGQMISRLIDCINDAR